MYVRWCCVIGKFGLIKYEIYMDIKMKFKAVINEYWYKWWRWRSDGELVWINNRVIIYNMINMYE
jgi:hypothetical protein